MEDNIELNQAVMPQEKISETDRMTLKLAEAEKRVALANAKTALAESEKAELSYRYLALHLARKYGLSEKDALNQNGDILRDAVQNNQGK